MSNPDWQRILDLLEPEPPKFCPHKPFLNQKKFLRSTTKEVLYGGKAGGGKLARYSTQVLTPFGWRSMGDLKVGDRITDPRTGGTQTVLQIWPQGIKDIYRVSFDDGGSTDCGLEHLWSIQASGVNGKSWARARDLGYLANDPWRVADTFAKMDTKGLDSLLLKAQGQAERGIRPNWPHVPCTRPVAYNITCKNPAAWWPIDPYILGLLLGDGHIGKSVGITSMDDEILTAFNEYVLSLGGTTHRSQKPGNRASAITANKGPLHHFLDLLGLTGSTSHTKFIPEKYLIAPIEDRFALMQGLMDTDGYVDSRGHLSYTSVSKRLAEDVRQLAMSLGARVNITSDVGSYRDSDGNKVVCSTAYTVWIMPEFPERFVRLARKASLIMRPQHLPQRRVTDIQRIDADDAMCITVSGNDGLYITDDFIVTHNSDALLMSALQYTHIPGYSAILFRNSYADLSRPGALMDRAKEWLQEHDKLQYSSKENSWRFPSGARVTFGYLDGPNDHLNYKGGEYQFIGYDELTEIREEHYTYLFSRLRGPSLESGHPLAKVPLRVRSASNPAPNWVRDRFIPHPDLNEQQLKQWHKDNPSKLFISSGFKDNPYINQEAYGEMLAELDPVHRAQLEHGDWWAEMPGAKFQKSWFKIVNPDDLPDDAYRNMVRYWDIAATEENEGNKDPDWTAGALVSYYDGYIIIHDMSRFRKDPGDMNREIRRVADVDGALVKIRMEQEPGASGKITINHFAQHVLLGYDFDGNRAIRDKASRVATWQPHVKRGNMLLVRGSWNAAFIDECISFEVVKDAHDDQLDAVSGAFEILTGIGGDGRKNRIQIIS